MALLRPVTDRAVLATIVLATFTVYAIGACRTIYVGDSGELVTAVYLLGIPHPSGYPLYVLLGKLWTLLVPIGSIAFRMSLFSAACASLACGVLYLACRAIPLARSAALTGALVLAFSGSFWSEANVQRVYALNVLFVTMLTYLVIQWHDRRDTSYMVAALFCAGLGATNHTVMAICGVAALLYMLIVEPSLLRRPLTVATGGAAFGVGLLAYAYLPLRSRANPALDWGNPESFSNLLDVILRSDFWERRWYEGPLDLLTAGGDYLFSFGSEVTWIGVALAGIGLTTTWRAGRIATRSSVAPSSSSGLRTAWLVLFAALIMLGNFLAVALHGSRSDIFIWHRYYLPSYAMLALLVGVGSHALASRLPSKLSSALLLIPAFLLTTGFRDHDRSHYRIAEEFSRALLHDLPPGARLIANDDNILFVLMYLHFVEGTRPDVDLILEGVGEANLPPVRFNPDRDPLFLTHFPAWRVEGLEAVPAGLVFRTARTGHAVTPPTLGRPHLTGELDPAVPKDYLTRNLIGHYHYMRGVTLQAHDWTEARREYERAAAMATDNDVLFHNLGLIFRERGLVDDAIAAFRRSVAINPRRIAGFRGCHASEHLAELLHERDRRSPSANVSAPRELTSAPAPGSPRK